MALSSKPISHVTNTYATGIYYIINSYYPQHFLLSNRFLKIYGTSLALVLLY
jgi:hypothetical protein